MIPSLHVITDDEILSRDHFLDRARELLAFGAGALAFHLRGPRSQGRTLYDLAKALMGPAGEAGGLLLVNDRVDVTLALGLEGVHLGQRSLPPVLARQLLGPERVLGVSVHNESEAQEGSREVDFLLVGTLFATSSHPGGEVGGLERVSAIRRVTELPLVGIGGITPERVSTVLSRGAHGVAVRGAIWDAPDPVGALGVFLECVKAFGRPEA